MPRFISIRNRTINTDLIAYVDFLESGRAMVFMSGLTQEKQNIPLDPEEARGLKALLEDSAVSAAAPGPPPQAQPSQAQARFL